MGFCLVPHHHHTTHTQPPTNQEAVWPFAILAQLNRVYVWCLMNTYYAPARYFPPQGHEFYYGRQAATHHPPTLHVSLLLYLAGSVEKNFGKTMRTTTYVFFASVTIASLFLFLNSDTIHATDPQRPIGLCEGNGGWAVDGLDRMRRQWRKTDSEKFFSGVGQVEIGLGTYLAISRSQTIPG